MSHSHSKLLEDLFIFEPTDPGSIGKWQRRQPRMVDNISLPRAGHAGVSISYIDKGIFTFCKFLVSLHVIGLFC